MKKLILLTAISISLVACSNNSEEKEITANDQNENSEESRIIDEEYFSENVTEGNWISYDGSAPVHDEFSYTDNIAYNPDKTYLINKFGYVSYFDKENFITTKKITKPYPSEIETVKNADSIKISFQTENAKEIELLEK